MIRINNLFKRQQLSVTRHFYNIEHFYSQKKIMPNTIHLNRKVKIKNEEKKKIIKNEERYICNDNPKGN